MTQFATASELASILQLPQVDTVTSNLLLGFAADMIREEVGQDIDLLTTAETYDGLNNRRAPEYNNLLLLLQRPTISITSVTENQTNVGVVSLVQGTDYVLGEGGKLYRIQDSDEDNELAWTTKKQGIVVTYTHGWDVNTPQYQTAKAISLQLSGRAYINPQAMYELRVGGYQVSYFSRATPITGLLQLTPIEKKMLDSLRPNTLTG